MSHMRTVPAQLLNLQGIERACTRLNLAQPRRGIVAYGHGQVKDPVTVNLRSQSNYPQLTADLSTGNCFYDADYQQEVDAFQQAYAVETAKMTAEAQGYTCTEQMQENGEICLEVLCH